MKNFTLSLFLLFGMACSAQTETAPSVGYDLPHFKRPNLIVADMERSLVIYRDILGFTGSDIATSSTDSFSYPVFNFPAEARMRYTYLGEPDEARVFGLTEVKGIELPDMPAAPHRTAHVIGVKNLEEKFEKLEALGLETTPSKIAGGAEFKFIEQAFVDYDGHLIVLYEILGN